MDQRGGLYEADVSYGHGSGFTYAFLLPFKIKKNITLEPKLSFVSSQWTGHSYLFNYLNAGITLRNKLRIANEIPYWGLFISYTISGDEGKSLTHEVSSWGSERGLLIGGEVFIRDNFSVGSEMKLIEGFYEVKVKYRHSGRIKYRDDVRFLTTQSMFVARYYFGEHK